MERETAMAKDEGEKGGVFDAMEKLRCFMDISIAGELEGRIIMEIVDPVEGDEFRALCTGERGTAPNGVRLHFKGTRIFRVIKGSLVRCGLISPDHVIDTYFNIYTGWTACLDKTRIPFGKLIKGFDLLLWVDQLPLCPDLSPIDDVIIEECGVLAKGEDDGVSNFFIDDGDKYPQWPTNLDDKPSELSGWIDIVESIKIHGNDYFKKKDFKMARRKYRKALRYLDFFWEKENIDEEKNSVLRKIKSVILTNSSACKLKLRDWKGALSDANSAIREKGNAKAFYRQAMACKALNNMNSAIHGFMSAQDLEPNDGLIKKEIAATVKALSSISLNSVNNKDETEPETDPKREIEVKSQSHANYEDQMKHELDSDMESEIEPEVIHDVLGGLKYIFRLCAFVTLGGFLFMTGDFKGETKKWWKMFTLVNSILFCISVWLSFANTVFKSFGGILQKRLSVLLHIFLPLLMVVIEISLAITIMAWDVPLSHSGAPAHSY